MSKFINTHTQTHNIQLQLQMDKLLKRDKYDKFAQITHPEEVK